MTTDRPAPTAIETKFHQYSKTDDPDVLAVLERNREGRREVLERAVVFSKTHGDTPEGSVYTSDWFGFRVTGIVSAHRPTSGRWKQVRQTSNGWAPYANNPLSGELAALRFKPEPIPGLPEMIEGSADRNGTRMMGNPHPFVLDGWAYIGFAFIPDTAMPEGSPWVEIKASELHAAMEAYNERLRS